MNEHGIEEVISTLYEMVQDARSVPLSSEKCVVERDRVLDLLDEISNQLPGELKQAKTIMLDAIGRDLTERFGLGDTPEKAIIAGAYTCDEQEAMQWKEEIGTRYPGHEIIMQPLSLSVACHIGAGALAVTVSRPLEIE